MIVYTASDLIFATRIRSTAEAVGVTTKPVRDAAGLAKLIEAQKDGDGELITGLLVDLDRGEDAIALIRDAKASGVAFPVIAFGAHVAAELLEAARAAGADEVMARGRFTNELTAILQRLDQ